MKIRRLQNVPQCIEAIGPERVKLLTGKRSQNLTNWKASGFFPPETFVVLTDALRSINCTAPPSLWRMIRPTRARAA